MHRYPYMFYNTNIPENVINSIENEFENSDSEYSLGRVGSAGNSGVEDLGVRNSLVKFKDPNHWVYGFIWHYIKSANLNFQFDINSIETLQYTKYKVDQFYNWHYDEVERGDMSNDQTIRKLSFTLQLSQYDEYEGGNVQLLPIGVKSKPLYIPREKGTLIVFDSRLMHRVTKVTKGERKSIVGWVRGPRWK